MDIAGGTSINLALREGELLEENGDGATFTAVGSITMTFSSTTLLLPRVTCEEERVFSLSSSVIVGVSRRDGGVVFLDSVALVLDEVKLVISVSNFLSIFSLRD